MSKINQIRSLVQFWKRIILNEISEFRMSEHTFMVVIAVMIGVLGGFGAILFRYSIRLFQAIFFGSWHYGLDYALHLHWYTKLLAPAAGGLVLGPIVYFFAREAKGHGVPEVMESIILRAGAIRPRVIIAKVVASAVCIGSGGSVGREGPIVQIGSGLGSALGQLFKTNVTQLRTFVACGTAAGIAATFNAPIAGALFAVEIILGDFGISQFSPIVVSSVAATVVSRHFLGDFSAFVIPHYELVSVYEMIPYVILGSLAALVALLFIKVLYKTEDIFDSFHMPSLLKPVLGGLTIGAVGIFSPHIFGVGYDTISLALNGQLVWYFLLFLIFMKVVATSITIGSGGSGGVFAPSLFIGASLGGLVGTIVHHLAPLNSANPGAYALVGMGAVAAGAMHAPITAILIIFELTNDYKIILPLMISCIISVLITTRLKKDSIYTMKLSRKGINIFKGHEVNVLRSLTVSQVLKKDYVRIQADTPLHDLIDLIVNSHQTNFFVADKNDQLLGEITIHDLRKIIYDSPYLEKILVAYDLMRPVRHYFTPTDTLDNVLKAFGDMNTDELPIVDNENEKYILGTVSKNDLIEKYNQEILRKDMVNSFSGYINSIRKLKQVELMDGQLLCEIEVPGNFINKSLRELKLRDLYNAEVVIIKQNFYTGNKGEQKIITAKPDYRFNRGDSILMICTRDDLERIQDARPANN